MNIFIVKGVSAFNCHIGQCISPAPFKIKMESEWISELDPVNVDRAVENMRPIQTE